MHIHTQTKKIEVVQTWCMQVRVEKDYIYEIFRKLT